MRGILGSNPSRRNLKYCVLKTAGTVRKGPGSRIIPLHALARNGLEPPFLTVQSMVLLAFVVLTVLAVKSFARPA
jgi:hypothetical protein